MEQAMSEEKMMRRTLVAQGKFLYYASEACDYKVCAIDALRHGWPQQSWEYLFLAEEADGRASAVLLEIDAL
jgi:hypothetical protein